MISWISLALGNSVCLIHMAVVSSPKQWKGDIAVYGIHLIFLMKAMSLGKKKMGTDVVLISKTSKALLTDFFWLLYYELISSAWVQMIFAVCPALNFNLNKNATPTTMTCTDYISSLSKV